MPSDYKKQRKELQKRGFKFFDSQHNGILYAKMVGKTLFRAVIQHAGNIKYYLPIEANKYQRRIFS